MTNKDEIVAIAMLTRADVQRVGDSLKLVFKTEDTPQFEDLLNALDRAEQRTTGRFAKPAKTE